MTKARGTVGFRTTSFLIAAVSSLLVFGCARAQPASCGAGPQTAARANALSLDSLAWAPFGRPESGWRIYEALAAKEIGSDCPGDSPEFAGRLAAWQGAHGLAARGAMDLPTLSRMRHLWQSRRPFVLTSRRLCPDPPIPSSLSAATSHESYGGKVILLRSAALDAYRAMVSAARVESPSIKADRRLLTIFSGFRSPAYDDARCALENNCQGITRAACSAHRTGLAMDLYLGAAPGFPPDSSADANRLFLSRSNAYWWLVHNAGRFGFVNYPFEPWHWEWIGEAP
jgi:zinc D-Ala-D-Ala carboxypeptidase